MLWRNSLALGSFSRLRADQQRLFRPFRSMRAGLSHRFLAHFLE
ncbi:protein of unknown function [Nitrospira defluvii]|uniref:Uncharacterized protein n=1 Tax=Nitrospira defluvii TaxID=330214 RepID=D8PDW4_9BACT|nr:protein of unknown function [Nitrospira defluvii]